MQRAIGSGAPRRTVIQQPFIAPKLSFAQGSKTGPRMDLDGEKDNEP